MTRLWLGLQAPRPIALNLFDRFEVKLEQYNGNITRSAVELARDWRTDKYLRRLEAVMIAADHQTTFLISGNGDVIEPDEDIIAIGSGGVSAQAAALALVKHSNLDPEQIVKEAMAIAASLCIYTNDSLTVEVLEGV